VGCKQLWIVKLSASKV